MLRTILTVIAEVAMLVLLVSALEKEEVVLLTADLVMDPHLEDTNEVGRFMAALLKSNPRARGVIAGDVCNEFPGGAQECYKKLLGTSWAQVLPLLHMLPGNHDYDQVGKTGEVPAFFDQEFQTGGRGLGYSVHDWGNWGVFLLNSEIMYKVDGVLNSLGVKQLEWMEKEMRVRSNYKCTLMVTHRPMYSSGEFASPAWVSSLFRKFHKYGGDVAVFGHEHFFARLPPLRPVSDRVAEYDSVYGIESLIVGTGGARLFEGPSELKYAKYGEVVVPKTPGIVKVILRKDRYSWEFLPARRTNMFTNYPKGEGVCHDNPPGFVE